MHSRMEYALWYLSFDDSDFVDYMDDLLRIIYNIDKDFTGEEYDEILNLAEERFTSLGLSEYAKFVDKIRQGK